MGKTLSTERRSEDPSLQLKSKTKTSDFQREWKLLNFSTLFNKHLWFSVMAYFASQGGKSVPLILQLSLRCPQPLFDLVQLRIVLWVIGQAVANPMVRADGFGRFSRSDPWCDSRRCPWGMTTRDVGLKKGAVEESLGAERALKHDTTSSTVFTFSHAWAHSGHWSWTENTAICSFFKHACKCYWTHWTMKEKPCSFSLFFAAHIHIHSSIFRTLPWDRNAQQTFLPLQTHMFFHSQSKCKYTMTICTKHYVENTKLTMMGMHIHEEYDHHS